MATFLTTRQVQDLINVDRSTVYRMAEDGRLPGVKIGRQWRFPADRITQQFGLDEPTGQSPAAPVTLESGSKDLRKLLIPEAAQSIADLLGDLFGVMAVVTDIAGRPLSTVANPCGFYAAIADVPTAADACLKGWRELADDPVSEPRFVPSHLGFLCARSFIRVEHQLVGMVIVGGITPPEWPPSPASIRAIADGLGTEPDALLANAERTWDVDPDRQQWILSLLPRVADFISQLALARNQLLNRLDAIATLAGPMTPHEGNEP